jgi:hypothetical protein
MKKISSLIENNEQAQGTLLVAVVMASIAVISILL